MKNENRTRQINLVGDSIYYINLDDPYHALYKMNLDRSNPVKAGSYTYSSMIIDNDIIYYTYPYQDNEGKLYSSTLDGKTRKKLSDDKAARINLDNDVIYYINKSDKNTVYSIGIDGSNRKKLSATQVREINIVGDWIYYLKINDSNIYRMSKDGSQNKVVKVEYN